MIRKQAGWGDLRDSLQMVSSFVSSRCGEASFTYLILTWDAWLGCHLVFWTDLSNDQYWIPYSEGLTPIKEKSDNFPISEIKEDQDFQPQWRKKISKAETFKTVK